MPSEAGTPIQLSRPADLVIHASCVVAEGRAVLIKGASGSGKSGLALQLMVLGAGLVADDQTRLWRETAGIWADAPEAIRGKIEAREVGILTSEPRGPALLGLIIDLDIDETERLPPQRSETLLGTDVPLLRKSHLPHFPAAILTYLLGTRDA